EARRPEITGKIRLLFESLEERQALPRESDSDPGLVMLADQRTAVARGHGREVRPLEHDDPHSPSGEVPRDARPHPTAAVDPRIGRAWDPGWRHGVPHPVRPYR